MRTSTVYQLGERAVHADTDATMGLELIGRTTGWVGLAWTKFPGNMVGSDAIIITDSAPEGMGVFKLQQKSVSGVNLQSAMMPGFQISNVRSFDASEPVTHVLDWWSMRRHILEQLVTLQLMSATVSSLGLLSGTFSWISRMGCAARSQRSQAA